MFVSGNFSQTRDKAGMQTGQFELTDQRITQCHGFTGNGNRFITRQASQRQDLGHDCGIVIKPDTQRITRLVGNPRTFQTDFKMADILGGIATRNLLVGA